MGWNPFTKALSDREIERIAAAVSKHAAAGDGVEAWNAAQRLLRASPDQRSAAEALLTLVDAESFTIESAAEVLQTVFERYANDRDMLVELGTAAAAARDRRYLNDAPPTAEVLTRLVERLQRAIGEPDDEHTRRLQFALGTLCRTLGRRFDELAEQGYRAALRANPERWQLHYDLGLFFKTRGRFAEGMHANEEAAARGGADEEAVLWNLGICATGAREAAVALRVWKQIGQKIEIGRFGLPEGGYPSTKVRLAEHPLAERSAVDDAAGPGLEETIWIERLSPCHGIIRSVLYQDLGVDYGDVVMFDGAPVTYHKVGDVTVPVFPHLATLERRNYRCYDFAGTQSRAREIAELSERLPDDAVIYSHSEQFKVLCRACWENPNTEHDHDEEAEHRIVTGRIATSPEVAPAELRTLLDSALANAETIKLFAPTLTEAAGDRQRAEVERRRYDMLVNSASSSESQTPG